jgi:hypothetical protein
MMEELEPMIGPVDWFEAFRQNPDQPQPGDDDFDVPDHMITLGPDVDAWLMSLE